MSTTIDERVVSMQFDNKHFEKNVATSMSTLDKLKQSLNLEGATKGLENVEKAAKNCDVSSVGESAEKVGLKFNAMYTIADQALRNITNAAMRAGKQIISSLTVDPIKTGLQEYETQMGAIQTILANTQSKGSTFDDVTKALDELNLYADKTIYNFTEMTRNIGTFTAAGVELDTSVAAIKGIANLAAVSGSTSQQASTAMYQLSQAMASGTVKLMDWNSVVNAGMGGQIFQDALKETAKAHGIAIDEIIEKNGSFRESLQEGWLTTQVLTDTLAKFTGDLTKEQILAQGYTEAQAEEIMKLGQMANSAATEVKTFTQLLDTLKESAQSGWSQTWKLIVGDFYEAKDLWTMASKAFGDIIENSSSKRNALLSGALNSGWEQLIDSGIADETGYSNHLKGVVASHGVAIDEMIKSEGSLEAALKKGLGEGTITSDMFAESLNNLVKEYETLTPTQLKNLGVTSSQLEEMKKLNEGFQNGSISMDEFTKKITRLSGRELLFAVERDETGKIVKTIGAIPNILQAIANIIKPIKEAWDETFGATPEGLYSLLEAFQKFTSRLIMSEESMDKLKRTFKGVFAVIDIVVTVIKALAGAIFGALGSITGLGGGILSVTAGLGDFVVGIRDSLKESKKIEKFAEGFKNVLLKIIEIFRNFGAAIKQKFDDSGFSGFLDFLGKVWEVVKLVVGKIINAFANVGTALFESFDGTGISTILDLLNAGLLSGILLKLKDLFGSVGDIVESFTGVMDSVTDCMQNFTASIKAKALVNISKAMLMLAISIIAISLINKEDLERSLAALAILFAGMMVCLSIMTKIPKLLIGSSQVLAIGATMLLLAFSLKKLSEISNSDLKAGLVAMTGALLVLTGTLKLLSMISKSKKMSVEGAGQLFKITLVLIPLSVALKMLSSMGWDNMWLGLTAMSLSLIALTGTLAVLSTIRSNKKMATEGAKQLFKISLALIPLAYALRMLGKMEWPDIVKSLVVMGSALVALTVALAIVAKIDKSMTKVDKKTNSIQVVVGKCAQLTLIAGALGILAVSLLIISKIDWTGIIKGLISMGAMLVILLASLKSISKMEDMTNKKAVTTLIGIAISIKALATTLALLGKLKWATIAKGLVAMSGTMAILATSLKFISKAASGAGEGSLVKAAASMIVMAYAIKILASSLLILGQLKLTTIAKGITAIAGVMLVLGLASKYLAFAASSLMSLAAALAVFGATCLMIGGGIALMAWALSLLGSSLGTAIETIGQAIINGADTIAEAMTVLLVSFLDSLVVASDKIVTTLLTILLQAIRTMSQFIPDMARALMDLLIGVVDALIEMIPELTALFTKLVNALFGAIDDAFSQIDTGSLLKATAAIGILGGLIVALAKIELKMLPKALLGVVGITALVLALGTIFGLLSKLSGLSDLIREGGDILQAIGSAIGMFIAGLIGGFSTGMNVDDNLNNAINVIKAIADPQVIVGLAAITGLMFVLSKIKTTAKDTAKDIAKLGIMIGALSVLVLALSAFGSISGSIGFIQKGVELLKLIGSPDVISSLLMISGLMAVLTLISKISSNIGTLAKSAANLTILFGIVAALAAALGGIASIPGSTELLTKGVAMLKLIASADVIISLGLMSALMAILSVLGLLAGPAITGAVALMGVIAIIGTCLTAFGALAQIPGLTWLINEGGNLLQAIGTAIGQFFGGIIGGVAQGVTSSLPAMGTHFSQFMTNLGPFLDGISRVKPETATAAKDLASALLVLTAANLLDQLTSWLTGGNDMSRLATDLAAFGNGIAAFGEATANVNPETISNASKAGKTLMEAISEIPKTGGFWQKIAGETDIYTFSNQLKGLGDGIANFGIAVTNVEPDKITAGSESLKTLTNAISTLPKTGGFWQKIAGEVDPILFGQQLEGLGDGVAKFGAKVANVSPDKIQAGADATIILANAVSQLPEAAGWWKRLWGNENEEAEQFKTNLEILGSAVSSFGNKVANIKPDAVQAGANACYTLVETLNRIPSEGGFWNIDGETFKTKLKQLGEAVVGFVNSLSSVSSEAVKEATGKLNAINEALKSFKADGVDHIINTFNSASSKIKSAVSNALQGAVDAINECQSTLKDSGTKMSEYLLEGIKSKEKEIKNAFVDMTNAAASEIKDSRYRSKFYDIGVYLVEGFADGIDESTFKATAAASAMAEAAKEAAKKAFRINSPSKEFYDIGAFAGQGLVNAFYDYEDKSYDAGYGVAKSSVKGLSNAISKVGDLIADGIDTQPTIKPILDLSEVTSGMNTMNSMFDVNPTFKAMSDVRTISSMMNKGQNGATNDDVVNAIARLEHSILDASGNTYNFNGITYNTGDEIQEALETIIKAIVVGGRR